MLKSKSWKAMLMFGLVLAASAVNADIVGGGCGTVKIGHLEVQKCDYSDSEGNKYFLWQDAMTVATRYGSGWHLPTAGELELVYKQKSVVGGFLADQETQSIGSYWSSTEKDKDSALCKSFDEGDWFVVITAPEFWDRSQHKVRAVRAF